jgi:hypothetical protein
VWASRCFRFREVIASSAGADSTSRAARNSLLVAFEVLADLDVGVFFDALLVLPDQALIRIGRLGPSGTKVRSVEARFRSGTSLALPVHLQSHSVFAAVQENCHPDGIPS